MMIEGDKIDYEKLPLCKDCKHCQPKVEGYIFKKIIYDVAICNYHKKVNLITGEIKLAVHSCWTQRAFYAHNSCGIEAQFFEAKS